MGLETGEFVKSFLGFALDVVELVLEADIIAGLDGEFFVPPNLLDLLELGFEVFLFALEVLLVFLALLSSFLLLQSLESQIFLHQFK